MGRAVGWGAVIGLVAGAMWLVGGVSLMWTGFGVSGCSLDPYELELIGEPDPCHTDWRSEAAWTVQAVGYGAFAASPVVATGPTLLLVAQAWRHRHDRPRHRSDRPRRRRRPVARPPTPWRAPQPGSTA